MQATDNSFGATPSKSAQGSPQRSLQRSSQPLSSQPLWIAAIWFGVGLFDATQTVFVMRSEGMHHAWGLLFVTEILAWVPWALATPMALRLARSYPPAQWKRLSTWSVHLSACAAIGLLFATWNAALEELLNPYANVPDAGRFSTLLFSKFENGLLAFVILYSFILAVSYVLDTSDRLARQETETARLNEQLSKAQLNALRRQIEPHFLFNTLNAIAGLVREQLNDAAVSMIAGLSDCLRRVMDDSNRQQISLGEELEFVEKYLNIQKVRFEERLQLNIDVPSELFSAQVPSLLLQPMVENAIKHGIAKRVQGGAIRIAGVRSNGSLKLSVYNDGPGLPADWEKSESGIGISNVRSRLRGLYGDAFEFTIKNQTLAGETNGGTNGKVSGVEVSVSLPFALAPNISAGAEE